MTQGFDTNSLHFGYEVEKTTGARAVPIYQTSSFVFENTKHAADLFSLKALGNIYTRLNNPTNDVLEKRIASLEGGVGALAFASGAAAITGAILTILKAGDHIVSSSSLYGGTYNLFKVTLPRIGIKTTFVDQADSTNFDKAILPETRAIFLETIGNPKLDIPDFEAIAQIAQKHGIPLIVDNTTATPWLFKPLLHGANIVVHSLTKFIGGHGTSLGGIVVDGGNFNWANGKFPEFTEPSPGYHGLKYYEALGNLAYIYKARLEVIRDTGAALSPFNAFQILQGVETLSLRLEKHSQNALQVANFLEAHPLVESVSYPGLKSHPTNELAVHYLKNGFGGLLTFRIKGGFEAAQKFTDNTNLFSLLANIGDARSLIIHPASTTHQQLTTEERESSGVYDNLIRLSVGLEDIADILDDIKQAFTSL